MAITMLNARKPLHRAAGPPPAKMGLDPRIASICMFVVLTNLALGVQVSAGFSVAVVVLLIVAVASFTWRAFSSNTPFGWVQGWACARNFPVRTYAVGIRTPFRPRAVQSPLHP